jgi:serine/threonine protein kinase
VKGQTLYSLIVNAPDKGVGEKLAMKILYELALAVNHLHSLGYSHRDIKLENIMFTSDQRVKLLDYGFAKKGRIADTELIAGTPVYMAPELINGDSCTEKIDIWALGVILYCLLTGKMPFTGQNKKQINQQLRELDTGLSAPEFSHISQ